MKRLEITCLRHFSLAWYQPDEYHTKFKSIAYIRMELIERLHYHEINDS